MTARRTARSGRIPCLNPRCRRTAAAEGYEGEEIVCRQCWRLLPPALTGRDRELRRRLRQVDRLARQAGREAQANALSAMLVAAQRRNWSAIRAYLAAPPEPEGLKRFLAEMGLDG